MQSRHAPKALFTILPLRQTVPGIRLHEHFLPSSEHSHPHQCKILSPASLLHSPDRSGQAFRHCLPYNHRLHIIALNPIII